jgi:hypothetical protein
MKCCPTCQIAKSPMEFYRDKRTPDGLKSQCKSCHNEGNIKSRDENRKRSANAEHMRNARRWNPEKFRERERAASRQRAWTQERQARYELNLAVRRCEVVRPDQCESCGYVGRVTGHHDDYSKPLEVRWLCYPCHGKEHRND